jgi:hypothetical protein
MPDASPSAKKNAARSGRQTLIVSGILHEKSTFHSAATVARERRTDHGMAINRC